MQSLLCAVTPVLDFNALYYTTMLSVQMGVLRNSIRLLFTSVVVPGLAVLSFPVSNMVCCLYGSDAGCAVYGCDAYDVVYVVYALSESVDLLLPE